MATAARQPATRPTLILLMHRSDNRLIEARATPAQEAEFRSPGMRASMGLLDGSSSRQTLRLPSLHPELSRVSGARAFDLGLLDACLALCGGEAAR